MKVNTELAPALESFLVEFRKLKIFCDDEPAQLADLANSDESVRAQCLRLYEADAKFKTISRQGRSPNFDLKTKGVAQDYWRYREAYSDIVRKVHKAHAGPKHNVSIDLYDDETLDERNWWIADEVGRSQGAKIDNSIFFGIHSLDEDEKWALPPSAAEKIRDGLDLLDEVNQTLGIYWPGIFRRRELVPKVFIPDSVSWKLKPGDTDTWLSYLQEAQDCFVYGNTRASLALLRSILEKILKRHFRSQGESLRKLINSATRLPVGCNKADLHQLRVTANLVLHDSGTSSGTSTVCFEESDMNKGEKIKPISESAEGFVQGDPFAIMAEELKIVRYFTMVKILIENISK